MDKATFIDFSCLSTRLGTVGTLETYLYLQAFLAMEVYSYGYSNC